MDKFDLFIMLGIIIGILYAIWADKKGIEHKFL